MVSNSNAREIDIDLYGLSYHIDGSRAWPSAPKRLDARGQTVINPGIGITYDFREDISENGFSTILVAGYIVDCNDEAFYFSGVAGRYKRFIGDTNFIWEVNAGAIRLHGYAWQNNGVKKTYYFPIANGGIGYKLDEDYIIKMNFSYIPEDKANYTSDLIFMQIGLAF
jgi:hypothetical protein